MRKLKGFTLIELLVVIAIIGILATVVIINVSSARAKANQSSALSTIDSLQKGLAECIVDGGTITTPHNTGSDVCDTLHATGILYPNVVVGKTFTLAASKNGSTGFTLTASSADPACTLTCTMSGCVKTSSTCY